jgi:hypothetical protein
MQRQSTPLSWYPKGVSDTLDATEVFPGAMAALTNLIPDPSTPNLWQCRPAATVRFNFATQGGAFSSGFSSGFLIGGIQNAGVISALKVVGQYAFGMVPSSLNPGYDQPFCVNLSNNQQVAVSGINAGNVPVSTSSSGPWTPPTMDVIGSKVVVTHPGFGATANFFGWFDISNPIAPVWNAGTLTGLVTLSAIPSYVAQFNNRAYFIVNNPAQPAVIFTDALNATNCTNANQVLTFGDTIPLTALGQLKFFNQLGGIVQSLIVFKGVTNMYQITGDAALQTLAINAMNVATGTLSPLGMAPTKSGLSFLSPDGMRIVDFQGNISDPIGVNGEGVSVPFIFSSVPSRAVMAANGSVIRISVQNGNAFGNPNQEWWYDIARKCWHGPHTFPASLIQPYTNTFIMCPIGVPGSLWQSDPVQGPTSLFVENGTQLNWGYSTAFLPNTKQMNGCAMTEALLECALSSSAPAINVSAVDPNAFTFDTVTVSITGAATIWGAFIWGQAVWGAPQGALLPRQLQWHLPIVFAKLAIQASGQSNSAVRLGALHLRYQMLRYWQNLGAVA